LLNPTLDQAFSLRGTLLVNNFQKFSDGLSDFNKAIQLNPKGEYYLNRSICYYRLGDAEHAKADANIALQKGVDIGDSYRKLLNL
jgi:tetratricopeptide (TPR) repeat protein